MSSEFRVIGPPGTGKTTYLARQAKKAVWKYGASNVILTTLTRAGALEIAGRDTPIPPENIGTLHSLAWRACERPEIAEGKVKDWNESNKGWALSTGGGNMDEVDVPTYATTADDLMAQSGVLRQKMIPREQWAPRVRRFFEKWQAWKDDLGLKDFTDLIEDCINLDIALPGDPRVLMGDEAQDWSKLEATLMRKWGANAEVFVLVGDPDQSIFGWRGADPMIFQIPEVPPEQRRVLQQSWRVPRSVLETVMSWIAQVDNREPIDFLPRDEAGSVVKSPSTFRSAQAVIDLALEESLDGRSVLILTTCAYMLEPVKALLRDKGIPFHNPYRPTRGDWNPLSQRANAVSACDRLISFIAMSPEIMGGKGRMWSAEEFQNWTKHIKAKDFFKHGAKAEIEAMFGTEGALKPSQIIDFFLRRQDFVEAMTASSDADLEWFIDKLTASKRKVFDYPAKVFASYGYEAIAERPLIAIGTIHSVKGGEADTVVLFPDLSFAGIDQYMSGGEGRNEIIRQFYVGMTRARQNLILAAPASRLSVSWQ